MLSLLQHWYFYIPHYLLLAAIVLILCRLALSVAISRNSTNILWRITEPLMRITRFITPVGVPEPVALLFCALWLMVLRVQFILTMDAWRLLPPIGAAP
jgi:hypothetical protein